MTQATVVELWLRKLSLFRDDADRLHGLHGTWATVPATVFGPRPAVQRIPLRHKW